MFTIAQWMPNCTLSVVKKYLFQGETRKVQQFNFTGWPNKGVPQFSSSLLNFRRIVRSHMRRSTGPIVVHCRWILNIRQYYNNYY